MRYIDPHLIQQNLPVGWAQRAQQAAEAVASAQAENRSDEIKKYDEVWRDLKATLKRVSHDKCWYCESLDVRSDNAVDHFRPKNAVTECPDHDGYWWLAFQWANCRFSCTYCNSRRIDHATGEGGGKAACFPLRQEERRARTPTDNLTDEEALLLDPTAPADPGFLWFDETGQAMPHPVCGTNAEAYLGKRATVSIELYHLNHTDVIEQRKVLCSEIRRQVEDVDRYFAKYCANDGTARQAFDDAVHGLRKRIAEDAQYSATARAMLMGLRGKHPVVDVILAAA